MKRSDPEQAPSLYHPFSRKLEKGANSMTA